MTTRTTFISAALLTLAMALAACSAELEQAATQPPATSDQPPATADQPPTATAQPSPTAEPTATSTPAIVLPDLGPAPDITNELWLNTDRPLNLEALQGEVVLVEFWTFG